MKHFILAITGLFFASQVWASDAQVVDVKVKKSGMVWHVSVTLKHEDTGWDHYADGWEVLDSEGNQLGFRKLLHPHVHEQPFTRSLNDLVVPDGTREIFIKTRCSVDEWSDETVRVALSP